MQPIEPTKDPSTAPSEEPDSDMGFSSTHSVGDVIQPESSGVHKTHMPDEIESSKQDTPTLNSSLPSLDSSEPTLAPKAVISSSQPSLAGEQPNRHKPKKKLVVLIAGLVLLLGGGSAAAYFGYYIPNKPENIWSTALERTGKGYDKLTQYATSKKNIKGLSAKGTFKISGSVAADGSFDGLSDGKNGKLTGSFSAVGLKVNYDVRAINSSGNTPDIYFKIDGLQDIGSLIGSYGASPEVSKALNGLNGQWYFVDHTLFDQFAKGSNSGLQFSSADVDAVLKAVGDSSKQYLFTTDPTKMAVAIQQNVGKEKQDGRSVYHYKVGVNKNNLKAYNKSLCDNLIKTKLFKLFSGGSSGDEDFTQECYDTTGLDKIDSSRTADAWVDLHTKLIHKVRFAEKNNANNYIEVAQNYTGGDEFPFSFGFHSQASVDSGIDKQNKSKTDTQSGLINMKLNMKTNTFSADATFGSTGSSSDKGTFKLTVAPSNEAVKVDKPGSAKTIIQLLNDLGLGEGLSTTGSQQTTAKDTKRRTDINALQSQLEVYYTDNGVYPTLANLNDAAWRKANLPGFDDSILKDPAGTQAKLVAVPQAKFYAYSPKGCDSAGCSSYTVTATLDGGTALKKDSFN
jgi:type II secretory pathway pseudopilin PulG